MGDAYKTVGEGERAWLAGVLDKGISIYLFANGSKTSVGFHINSSNRDVVARAIKILGMTCQPRHASKSKTYQVAVSGFARLRQVLEIISPYASQHTMRKFQDVIDKISQAKAA